MEDKRHNDYIFIPYNDNTCINTNLENIPNKDFYKTNQRYSAINSQTYTCVLKKIEYSDMPDNKNSLNV
jgi:hypothetical protein